MKTLHVLYDAECGLCRACREWLEAQPQYVRLEFHAAQAPETARRFPGLGAPRPAELVAVDERGRFYRGERAWVIVLWALKEYRGLADTLASPLLMPIARRVISAVSERRHGISKLLQIRR